MSDSTSLMAPSLTSPALEAILAEWKTQPYDPPKTDFPQWLKSIESLSDTYGIPDTQRPQCAIKFIKTDHLRNELEKVLEDAQSKFGPIHWDRFKIFMTAYDRDYQEKWKELPIYRKHPKIAGAGLGIIGTTLLAPVAVVGVLSAVGFTSVGITAGSIAATIQSAIYGGATGGLFALLQSAGASMAIPPVGTILAGAATAATGIAVMTDESSSATPLLLLNLTTDGQQNNTNPNTEHLLTPKALQAILKSWKISPYNPPTTHVSHFLSRIHTHCEEYGVPAKQQAQCAMHHMRPDCREDAHTAECHNMSWDQYNTWLIQYDGAIKNTSEEQPDER